VGVLLPPSVQTDPATADPTNVIALTTPAGSYAKCASPVPVSFGQFARNGFLKTILAKLVLYPEVVPSLASTVSKDDELVEARPIAWV